MNVLSNALIPEVSLPSDIEKSVLVGRVWRNDHGGPAVVSVRGDEVFDISKAAPTLSHLICSEDPLGVASTDGEPIGDVEGLLRASHHGIHSSSLRLLAPVDLQPVKATGVTFVTSLLERIIEEKAEGNKSIAAEIRHEMASLIGSDLSDIRPGSPESQELKRHLQSAGMWSQYLEVGIGPDAEIFTKCLPMAAVGTGAEIGILRSSTWNNPEPELALVVSSSGLVVGASLANDVNLRDIEGRSALLLGKAKDNNASTAIGPFIRLLDREFSIDDLRTLEINLRIDGPDGFELEDTSSIALISRDLLDLVKQTIGKSHQYPDGLVLLSGTMFAPTIDRGVEGLGFTHQIGDVVQISSPRLGTLANQVQYCQDVEPWTFGLRALMQHVASRGIISSP